MRFYKDCLGLGMVGVIACLLAGCQMNRYENFYTSFGEQPDVKASQDESSIILKPAISMDDIVSIMEDGYEIIGSSSFESSYAPMSYAVDTAKKHGAELVWLNIVYKETRQETEIIPVPSTSTTYVSGSIDGRVGYGMNNSVHGSYSGTATTTTIIPVPIQVDVEIYQHDAVFYRKIDLSKRYGIIWHIPPRLPTESIDSPTTVSVMGVMHGSRAEKDGTRRGQIIRAINGKPIRTRRDVAPFLANELSIKEVEACDEK